MLFLLLLISQSSLEVFLKAFIKVFFLALVI